MNRVWALTRFRFTGYVRSFRALHPLIALFLLLLIVIVTPLGGDPRRQLLATFGDLAALMYPIWAWAARGVLDTEPDTQRDLSGLAVGSPARSVCAGLLAAYGVNICLAFVALGWPLANAAAYGLDRTVTALMVVLHLLAALPATLVGAWTCRAVLPRTEVSILALLGGCVVLLLLGIGPLHWVSVPMIGWMRAANAGPAAVTGAFPGLAVHILAWSAVVGAGCFWIRRLRR